MIVKNTFIDIAENYKHTERAASAPPGLQMMDALEISDCSMATVATSVNRAPVAASRFAEAFYIRDNDDMLGFGLSSPACAATRMQ